MTISLIIEKKTHLQLARRRSGLSVGLAVDRLAIHLPSRLIPKNFKCGILCLVRSIKKNSVKNMSVSLLFVSLGKTLGKMPPSLYGRQVAHLCFTGLEL